MPNKLPELLQNMNITPHDPADPKCLIELHIIDLNYKGKITFKMFMKFFKAL